MASPEKTASGNAEDDTEDDIYTTDDYASPMVQSYDSFPQSARSIASNGVESSPVKSGSCSQVTITETIIPHPQRIEVEEAPREHEEEEAATEHVEQQREDAMIRSVPSRADAPREVLHSSEEHERGNPSFNAAALPFFR